MAQHPPQHTSQPAEDDTGDPHAGHRFFDRIRRTGLVRADSGWFGGVAAMVAARVRWDATLVRGILVILTLLFFPPIALTYGLLWLLLPDSSGRIHLQRAVAGEHGGGLIGGGLLAAVGALTLLSPFSLTGAVGVVLNVLVLAGLVWLVTASVRRGRRSPAEASQGSSGYAEEDSTRPMPRRTDGRPAWYPTTAAPEPPERYGPPEPSPRRDPASRRGRGDGRPRTRSTTSADVETPGATAAERERRSRRRLLTFGTLLLAVPTLLGLMAVGGVVGISPLTAVLSCLIVVVLLMSSAHIVSAVRGRRGRGFLLVTAAAAMVLVFTLAHGQGFRGDGLHAFGTDTTDAATMRSAFSATTMDLRHLDPAEAETVDGVEVHYADVSTAFSSLELLVPDDVEVVVDANQAFGGMSAHTVEGEHEGGGLSSRGFTVGPADAERRLHISINAAFNSIELYDATTYAQETGSSAGSGEGR
ncbi:MAG: PspC domain-containing protein [Nesterenkonia sp.]|nr:PspC domain-containing protein [Nesterenkonia sp.]